MKVTKERVLSKIKSVEYHVTNSLKQTYCIMTMNNGFEITGISGLVDPSNYDQVIGEEIAYENAFNKAWELEGYLLQEELYNQLNQ